MPQAVMLRKLKLNGSMKTYKTLSITNCWSLPKPKSIQSVMPSNHLILCRPLLLPPSISPSIRVFSNESALHIWWPKYWRFSFSPSNEYLGLISFRIDWFYLLAVQGTFKRKETPTPQFEIINSSGLSFLSGPTLTFVYNSCKIHSFDYAGFIGIVMSLPFLYTD